jgi:hypothetical protein
VPGGNGTTAPEPVELATTWPTCPRAKARRSNTAVAPSGSLIGPTLVALWLSATAASRAQTVSFLLVAAVFTGLTGASLADLAGIDVELSGDDGAVARTAALGALFVLAGLQALPRRGREVEL